MCSGMVCISRLRALGVLADSKRQIRGEFRGTGLHWLLAGALSGELGDEDPCLRDSFVNGGAHIARPSKSAKVARLTSATRSHSIFHFPHHEAVPHSEPPPPRRGLYDLGTVQRLRGELRRVSRRNPLAGDHRMGRPRIQRNDQPLGDQRQPRHHAQPHHGSGPVVCVPPVPRRHDRALRTSSSSR